MSEGRVRAGECEPGLAVSVFVVASLMLALFIVGDFHFITLAAKEEASLPVEVEVSLEAATPEEDKALSPALASATSAEAQPSATEASPVAAAALPEPEVVEPEAVEPEPAETEEAENARGLETPAVDSADEETLEAVNPPAEVADPSGALDFPGNMDLMPKPHLANRLNPALAGMPMPAKPKPAETLPTEGEGKSQAVDAPESGSGAPELQVTAVSGQAGVMAERGKGIVVQALINHLGVVEAVEILEGSSDRIADVMAANAIKQQLFKFSPPIPPGQKVLRTFTLNLSAEDLP